MNATLPAEPAVDPLTDTERLGDGVVVLDGMGRIRSLNRAAERLLGVVACQVRGRSLGAVSSDLLPPPDAGPGTHAVTTHDGRAYELSIGPLLGEDGVVLVWHDLTTRQERERELTARKQLASNLLAVARATTERPTLEATLQNTLDVVASLTGAEAGSLCLVDEGGRLIHGLFVHGAASSIEAERSLRRRRRIHSGGDAFEPSPTGSGDRQTTIGEPELADVVERGLSGWVLRENAPVLVPDTRADARWCSLPGQDAHLRAAVVVPIGSGRPNHPPVGVLAVDHSLPGHFQERDLELLAAAAGQIALALRNAQMFDDRERHSRREAMLHALLHALGRERSAAGVARVAEETIRLHTGWPETRVVLGSAVTGCAEGSGLVLPLIHAGRTLGSLVIGLDCLNRDEEALAASLAEATALALENARLDASASERRARLEAVLESSREGILLLGSSGSVYVVNQRALALLGAGSGVWVGSPGAAFASALAAGQALVEAELARASSGGPAVEGETDLATKRVRFVGVDVRSDGRHLGRLLMLRDVSDERAAEKLREDLVHMMVHDLRNPLTAVVTVLCELDRRAPDGLSETDRRLIGTAWSGARRVWELVDSILEVSRLESGTVPLRLSSFALAALVDETFDVLQPLAAARDQTLTRCIPDDLPAVEADRVLLARVLQNLVSNAVKFSPNRGTIEVTAAVADGELWFSVTDEGAGIPAEISDRLFGKFVAGPQRGRGSGLGLAFCRLAVEAHGGRVWAANRAQGGAAFEVTIPAAR